MSGKPFPKPADHSKADARAYRKLYRRHRKAIDLILSGELPRLVADLSAYILDGIRALLATTHLTEGAA